MPQSAKQFALKLNQCLDEIDAPRTVRDRTLILTRMLDIPKQLAFSLLEGQQLPDSDLLKQIAKEFEVEMAWLAETNA